MRSNPTVPLSVIGLRSVCWSTIRVPNIVHSGAFLGSKTGLLGLLNGSLGLSGTVGLEKLSEKRCEQRSGREFVWHTEVKWIEKSLFGGLQCYVPGASGAFRTVSEGKFSEVRFNLILRSLRACLAYR